MIDLYFWPTPNGYKITWMLEEVGLKYNVIPVNIGAGDQFKPKFLKISPNNRMPAIIDPDGQRRPDAGPGASLPPLRARETGVCDQPLHQRGQANLRRDRQAAGRSEVPGGRILDRRHRDLPVAGAAFDAGAGARRFPESEKMVRRAARAPCNSARLRSDER